MSIQIYDPTTEVTGRRIAFAPRPKSLEGLRIGLVDNTKHNFDLLVQEMGALLKERFGVKAVVHRRKANASTAAADEIIEGLAKDCDLVFAGSGD